MRVRAGLRWVTRGSPFPGHNRTHLRRDAWNIDSLAPVPQLRDANLPAIAAAARPAGSSTLAEAPPAFGAPRTVGPLPAGSSGLGVLIVDDADLEDEPSAAFVPRLSHGQADKHLVVVTADPKCVRNRDGVEVRSNRPRPR